MSYDRAKSIFLRASEMDSGARATYLADACGEDAALRRDVEDLLRHHERLGSFLDETEGESSGTTIGPYRLLEKVGEGGFGVVYVAQQTEPVRRRVALKVIKAGMDTREVVTRFEAERQALALMDHPNIARVFDGGSTPGGRPYFVMELVKGIPIQEYCDRSQLPLRERLELFVRVCRAVQHAHQKGIIHRDIKPSNVLVAIQEGKPVPKVIDFGVAKATGQRLTEATFHTRFAQMVGTPQYMSPEQAEMSALDVDTRSDVYSLGVLLYELLTGTTPLTRERIGTVDFDELRKIIREEDPPTPSARLTSLNGRGTRIAAARRTELPRLIRTVHGELDWIVMRALEKDRTRRYETATAFAADVERYLADEPVEAGPPSRWYRAKKLVRRNRMGAVVALLTLCVFAIGGGAIGWIVSDRAARRTATEQQIATALAEAERCVRQGEYFLAGAALQRAQGLAAGGEAGDATKESIRHWRTDLAMLQRLEKAGTASTNTRGFRIDSSRIRREYRRAFEWYGLDFDLQDLSEIEARIDASAIRDLLLDHLDHWVQWLYAGDESVAAPEAILARLDRNLWRRRVREAANRNDVEGLKRLAGSPEARAQHLGATRALANSLERNGEVFTAIDVLREALRDRPADFWLNFELAGHYQRLRPPNWEAALRYNQAALALNPRAANVRCNLAGCLSQLERPSEAASEYLKAIELDPDSAAIRVFYGEFLVNSGSPDRAIAQCRQAAGSEPDFAATYDVWGRALHARNEPKKAVAMFQRAIDLDPKLALPLNGLGTALHDLGELEKARVAFRQAIDLDPNSSEALMNLGVVLMDQERPCDAAASIRRAIELDGNEPRGHRLLGSALLAMDDPDGAVLEIQKALDLDPDRIEVLLDLGTALQRAGEPEKAEAQFRRVLDLDENRAIAYYDLGVVLGMQQRTDEAFEAYRTAIRLDSGLKQAHVNLGNIYGGRGNPDAAFREYERAIAIDAGFLPAVRGRASALCQLGRWSAAADAGRKVIDLSGDDVLPEDYFRLGLALENQGLEDAAVTAYRDALALEPRLNRARVNFGNILMKRGELDKAVAQYEKALEIDAKFPYAHFNLATALGLQEKWDDAAKSWQDYLKLVRNNPRAYHRLGRALLAAGRFDGVAPAFGKAAELSPGNAGILNEFAWFLATCPEARFRDPKRAVDLARHSLELPHRRDAYFNTLGVALYRAGEFDKSIKVLEKSAQLGEGGDAFDFFFLAMAKHRLGQADAGDWFDKAVAWMAEHKPDDPELRRFRAEAEELLGSRVERNE